MSVKGAIQKTSAFAVNAANKVNDYTKYAEAAAKGQNAGFEGVNSAVNWIKNAADSAMALIDKAREPIQKLPPILMLCRLKYLPGLSATQLTGLIIQELSDRGFITSINADGTPNRIIEFVQCMIGPIVQHIKDCAAVQGMVTTPAGMYTVSGKVD